MSEKIKLVPGENVHINRNVLVYDGKEKRPQFHVYHYRKSLWVPDTTVSTFLEEETEYSHTEGDYILKGDVCATEPGKYTAVLHGIRKYECEIPLVWEIFPRDDPRITENPYADYFLGKKSKYDLYTSDYHPLNMDDVSHCDLPNYEQVISYYQEEHKPKNPLMVHYSVFHMQSSYHTYQDSFYPREACSIDIDEAGIFRAAISDGVTQSYMSKVYADLITEQFCKSGHEFLQNQKLNETGRAWMDFVLQDAKNTYPNNPWMLRKEKRLLRHKRASATLAGIELFPKSRSTIITTVGDSVVFKLMKTENEGVLLLNHTPNITWKEFTNHPKQLHSDDLLCPDEYIERGFGTFSNLISNDQVYFMICSDALAQHLLSPQEDLESNRFETLLNIRSNEEFTAYCQKQKETGTMHDDDYTMCIVWVAKDAMPVQSETEIQ